MEKQWGKKMPENETAKRNRKKRNAGNFIDREMNLRYNTKVTVACLAAVVGGCGGIGRRARLRI